MRLNMRSIIAAAIMAVFMAVSLGGNALAKEKEAEFAYVEWACATATAHLVEAVLEEKMDYDIDLTSVGAAAMWQALGTGDVDAITCAWLPGTHGDYLEGVKDDVEDLGPNLEGAKIGLVVPEYVTIDSIEELNENADKFDGEITGIDPGAGIMSATEDAVEKYNITDMELKEGSDAMMTAVLKDKIKNDEWVVVTGWTPHWKFGAWDLKYLEDPEGVYGDEETINTVVRKGLKDDDPELFAFLDKFYLELEDLHELMAMNQEEDDPEGNARKWMEENPEKVEKWLP
ncbi:MAG: glycine betaine ABC transporter substrate-binding protein [Desulfobacterales bacterium]